MVVVDEVVKVGSCGKNARSVQVCGTKSRRLGRKRSPMPLAFSYDAEEAVDLWVTRWSRLRWLRWTLGAAAPSNS